MNARLPKRVRHVSPFGLSLQSLHTYLLCCALPFIGPQAADRIRHAKIEVAGNCFTVPTICDAKKATIALLVDWLCDSGAFEVRTGKHQ